MWNENLNILEAGRYAKIEKKNEVDGNRKRGCRNHEMNCDHSVDLDIRLTKMIGEWKY